jgi:predicted ester cyclase
VEGVFSEVASVYVALASCLWWKGWPTFRKQGEKEYSDMLEENKVLSRLFIEGYVRGDTHIVDELLAPDFVFYDPSSATGEVRAEDMKASIEWMHSVFPDAQVTIEDQVAEGDKVVSRFTVSGTHQGEIMGAAPTGRLVTHTGHQTDRFERGKIVESWTNWDALGLLQEIGAIPSLG